MFSHNGASGPESQTTLFRRVRQVAAPVEERSCYLRLQACFNVSSLHALRVLCRLNF